MNILLVTDSYPPEIRSASHLMQELAEGLRDRGHKITVATSYPSYNLTDELRRKVFPEYAKEDNITIIRVKTLPHHKVNFIIRGISQLSIPYIFLSKINKYLKDKLDIVIVYSPPLTLARVGKVIKRRSGARFIFNVQDIFPQNAIDLGVLKNKFLIKFFENIEKNAYKSADRIVVHSKGNRDFVVNIKGASENKVHILHNWIDITTFVGRKRTGMFRRKYGLENEFIFLFAGVIGPSQGLDLILDIANNIKDMEDICFLIVGDGMEKERLLRRTKELRLKNIIFKPFVSKEDYPALVKDADVGLVCLSSLNTTPVVPGKILGYMAASVPVIAFLNKESDGHKIISDAHCGYSEISDNVVTATQSIMKIYNERDRLKGYGENGFNYVKNNFEKNVCISCLENLFV